MRSLIAALFAFVLSIQNALAQETLPSEPGIESTIQSQIEAFKADDFVTAFTFASPGIQGIFGDPDNFGRMVRQGYPMVWRPSELRFLELRSIDGRLWQKVMVRDQTGSLHILDYQMVSVDGEWQINGVQLLRAPDVGA